MSRRAVPTLLGLFAPACVRPTSTPSEDSAVRHDSGLPSDTGELTSPCSDSEVEAGTCADVDPSVFTTDDPVIADDDAAAVYRAWKAEVFEREAMDEGTFDNDFTVLSVIRESDSRTDEFDIDMALHVDWIASFMTVAIHVTHDEWADDPDTELQTSIRDAINIDPVRDIGSVVCWGDVTAAAGQCEALLGAETGAFTLDPCSAGFVGWGDDRLVVYGHGEVSLADNECANLSVDLETGELVECTMTNCWWD